nr:immunoglobulin heavy chain junction region [Mus musculus]
CASLTGTNW